MKKTLACLLMLLALSACDNQDELAALSANINAERVWIFLQVNVPQEEDKIDAFYYYAHVSKSLYQGINQNDISSGFILLNNVKYWGHDDLIHDYKGGENSGQLVFRIEDIRRIKLINKEPIDGLGDEQFDEVTLGDDPAIESDPEGAPQAEPKAEQQIELDAEQDTQQLADEIPSSDEITAPTSPPIKSPG